MGGLSAIGGAIAGQELGKAVGSDLVGDIAGAGLGFVGSMLPFFEDGGIVRNTGTAVVHRGEYVLPVGVKPTPAQRRAVQKRKANKLKKKVQPKKKVQSKPRPKRAKKGKK